MQTITFLQSLWKHKSTVRHILGSESLVFLTSYRPGHFYSPIPDMAQLRLRGEALYDRSEKLIPGIDLNEERQVALLDRLAESYASLPFPESETSGHRFYLDNGYFSFGDAIILHSFLRHFRPKRIIEVGSGFSSAAMLDINDRYFSDSIDFTFIEPIPDRLNRLLTEQDKRRSKIHVSPVQDIEPAVFTQLQANDILFIDSSHIARIDSDLLFLLFTVLPSLQPGVIVHFHDIPWPFEYPRHWIEGGRAFNEAYLLRAFLQYNSAFEILYFNSFMATHHADSIKAVMPLVMKSPSDEDTEGNSSLWLRKR